MTFLNSIKFYLRYRLPAEWFLRRRHESQLSSFCTVLGGVDSLWQEYSTLLSAHPDAAKISRGCFYEGAEVTLRDFYSNILWFRKRNEMGSCLKAYPQRWSHRFRTIQTCIDCVPQERQKYLYFYPNDLIAWLSALPVPVKIIYVVDNPFDYLVSFLRDQEVSYPESISEAKIMDRLIGAYFTNLCPVFANILQHHPQSIQLVYTEQLLEQPWAAVHQSWQMLGLAPEAELSGEPILFNPIPQARHTFSWSPEQIARIEEGVRAFPYLSHFRFSLTNESPIACGE